MDVSYLLLIFPLPSPGIELTLFGYVTVPCVLEDICVWISGYYKPNVFSNHSLPMPIWQFKNFFLPELILQLCCSYCFSLALFIYSSHIVLISMLGRLRRFLWPRTDSDSLSLWIFQWCSLSIISTWSHRGWWSPFSFHMWSATPDFSISPCVTAFWCSWSLTLKGWPVYISFRSYMG